MKTIKQDLLCKNTLTDQIYSEDINFENLIMSISLFGILEPLIVFLKQDKSGLYQVVSGNRRLMAAIKLGINEIPCLIIDPVEINEARVRAHQEQRFKQPSDIIRELRILEQEFGLKQGVRSNSEKILEAKSYKDKLIRDHTKSKLDRLRQFDKKLTKLADGDMEIYNRYMNELNESGNISGALKRLDKQLKDKENKEKIPSNFKVEIDSCIVYPKSSEDVSDLEDESIQMVMKSPPYYGIKNYDLGKNELGREDNTDTFVSRLANHFSEYKRVIKKDGTLWINLGDFMIGNSYRLLPERFALSMMVDGWILHDRIVWAKTNPVYTDGKRSVNSTEQIFVFKKNAYCKFQFNWLEQYRLSGKITYGYQGKGIKLKNFFDFRDNVVITNIANNHVLSEACKKEDIHLTHSATFPITIPIIAILTGSDIGDTILDPFSGTATTGKACQILERNYVGYELNPTYMKQGEIRLKSPNEDYVEYFELAEN